MNEQVNERIIEVEKRLARRYCRQVYRENKTYLALHSVPVRLGKAGAQAWHAEAARIIDEELAAEIHSQNLATQVMA